MSPRKAVPEEFDVFPMRIAANQELGGHEALRSDPTTHIKGHIGRNDPLPSLKIEPISLIPPNRRGRSEFYPHTCPSMALELRAGGEEGSGCRAALPAVRLRPQWTSLQLPANGILHEVDHLQDLPFFNHDGNNAVHKRIADGLNYGPR